MPMKNVSFRWQILLSVLVLASFISVNFGFYSSRQTFIDGDGNGYYAYLPAIFIYQTIDFEQFVTNSPARDEKYHQPHYFFQKNGVLVNKYTCGIALLQTPLFLTALGISSLTGLDTNGYSVLFQYSVALSGLVFLFLGLHFLQKLLQSYNLPNQVVTVVAIVVVFATNLFFYAFIQPSFSHVYSFFAVTLFAFSARRYFTGGQSNMLLLAAFALGLVVLIRPVNFLVVLAVPFLAGGPHAFLGTKTQRNGVYIILAAAGIFLATLGPQLIILTLQTGSPFQWLYPGEGFYLNHPRIIHFLFSYKKGWFVYTPFMLLLIPGLIVLVRRSKFEFLAFLCFLLCVIYLFSSWWNWFYGDGFGMRPMVDFYGLFLIPIGMFIHRATKSRLIIISGFIILATGLNLIQSYQYSTGILHADSMSRHAYWYTFLRTSPQYRNILGSDKESVFCSLAEKPFVDVSNDFERDYPDWIKLHEANTGKAHSGNHLLELEASQVYSFGYPLLINDTLLGRDDLYADFSVYYFESVENSAQGAIFVADVLDSRYHSLYYRNFRIKTAPDNIICQWRKAETGFRLPRLYEDASQVRFYIWNKDQGNFFLDDMEIKIFTILQN